MTADTTSRPLAVVTGASSGIGYELAKQFGQNGFDVVVAAEDAELAQAAARLRTDTDAQITPVQADLATVDGCEELYQRTQALGRPVDAIALNAGIGPGGDFFADTDLFAELKTIRLNVDHVVHLTKRFGVDMVARGEGRILITSSVLASQPAPYQAVYGGSKAFVQSLAEALRQELADKGADVTITALQPGPTDTEFFDRGDLTDSRLGASDHKDDPAKVAEQGFQALMKGKSSVVAGNPGNKVHALVNELVPDTLAAKVSKPLTRPGGAE
jgi:short-subunit dehydrogenase